MVRRHATRCSSSWHLNLNSLVVLKISFEGVQILDTVVAIKHPWGFGKISCYRDAIFYLIDYKSGWATLVEEYNIGLVRAIYECMQRTTARTFWLLLILLSGTISAWGQAKGTLSVTAVVQTSATWVQGTDGRWTLIVANAPDSLSTFSFQSGIQRQSPGQVAIKNDAQHRSTRTGSAVGIGTHNRSSK